LPKTAATRFACLAMMANRVGALSAKSGMKQQCYIAQP
jgi:hypothetical protein